MKKSILTIGSGIYQIGLIKELKRLNYNVISVDRDVNAPGFKFSDYKIKLSVTKVKKIILKLINLKLKNNILAVMTQAGSKSPYIVAQIAKILNLNHLKIKTAKLSVDKFKVCQLINNSRNIEGKLYDYSQINKIKNKYPYVCKVNSLSGGQGIKKIQSKKDLNNIKYFLKKNKRFYVEDYVVGNYYHIIGSKFNEKVKYYSILEKKLNIDFSNDYIFYNPNLNKTIEKKIYKFCQKTLNKLNFDFGTFQIEIIISNDNEIFISEIEPSLIGSYITELMIPRITNCNFIKDSIKLFVKKKLNCKISRKKKYAVLKYFYDQNGINLSNKIFKKFKTKKNCKILKKDNYKLVNKKGLAKSVIYFETKFKRNLDLFLKV